jgi:peptidoglycan/LPS O-acetylase OafA/YrhL
LEYRDSNKRIFVLDLLRGVAILLVIFSHGMCDPQYAGWLRPVANFFYGFGWSGVDLFFVLSGFLIGGLLFSELKKSGEIKLSRFYIRRGFKIWPSYYLFMGILVALYCAGGAFPLLGWHRIFLNIFFLQNFSTDWDIQQADHTWSLCVEEHFYLMLPALLVFLSRKRWMNHIPKVIVGIFVFCLVNRCVQATYGIDASHQLDLKAMKSFRNTFDFIDGLMFGVFLAYLRYFRDDVWTRLGQHNTKLWLVGIALLMPSALLNFRSGVPQLLFQCAIGLGMMFVGYGCLLCALLTLNREWQERLSKNWFLKLIAWIGFYSYATYLWHLLFLPTFRASLFAKAGSPLMWLWYQLLYCALAVVMGFLASTAVEQPFLRLREVVTRKTVKAPVTPE